MMKALGCHIYAGGFTLGVRQHFDVVAHFEDGDFGVETARRNLGVEVYQKSDGWPDLGDLDLIYCNPPCAPWSQIRRGAVVDWRAHGNLSCFDDCFGLLLRHLPGAWTVESVRGLYTRGLDFVLGFVAQARELGYCTYFVLVDGSEHGVPQRRKRVFLVLSRYEIDWRESNSRYVTAGEVLTDLEDRDTRQLNVNTGARWCSIVDKVPQGGMMKHTFAAEFPELLGRRNVGRGSFLMRRIDADDFSTTISGGCTLFHPTEHRFITVGETAALCGFPNWYRFSDSMDTAYKEIGKGVLPPVAEYLAASLRRGIERARRPSTKDIREVQVSTDKVVVKHV